MAYEVMGINSYFGHGVLSLSFVNSSNPYHLSFNPTSNTRQTQRIELIFSPEGSNTYAPGEIELRLPLALFKYRDGNYITNPSPMAIPFLGNTSFSYTIEDNDIVITNFREVDGSTTLLRAYFEFNFLPSLSANGFENLFGATVTFADVHGREPLVSNYLSFDLTTGVVPSNINQNVVSHHSSWQPAWGIEPDGRVNPYGYFFVRYSLHFGRNTASTQPFTMQIIGSPSSGGDIVAWSLNITNQNSVIPVINTTGNTEQFNIHAYDTWIVTPQQNLKECLI